MRTKFFSWIERITAPSLELRDPIERIEARALATLTIALILTVTLLTAFFSFGFHAAPSLRMALVSTIISAALLVPVFLLARTLRYRSAAALLWAVTSGVVLVSSILQPLLTGALIGMAHLIIAMLIGSVFFSFRTNVALLCLNFGGVVAFFFNRSDLSSSDAFSLIGFLFISWVAVFASAAIRRQTAAIVGRQQLLMTQYSKLAAMGEMAAGVAHEINNPLAIIQLHIESVLASAGQGGHVLLSQHERSLQMIRKTSERIANIVQGLLTISREAGQSPASQVALRPVIEQVATLCHESFLRHGVELKIEYPDPKLRVWANVTQLEQILLNLLNNAVDAVTSENHPIDLDRVVQLRIILESDGVRVLLMNSGPPIPAEIREKLFQPFFTTKGPGKGTGLGLSISRSLAEGQGGTLSLLTETEATTFELYLPLLAPKG